VVSQVVVAPANRPLASEGAAADLTFTSHADVVKRIIYTHVAETGGPITMERLCLILADLGVIRPKNLALLRMFPSHPYQIAVAKIVQQLYDNGELGGLDALALLT